MATSLSIHQNLILSPFPNRTDIQTPLFTRTHFGLKPFLRGSICVAKFGLRPDPNSADGVKELLGVAERLLFTLADAAVSSSDAVTTTKQNSDWLSGITNVMETVLKVLKDGMSTLHVPYAYGFAIILLTVIVKAATFPLTKKQVESSMAMRSLAPQVKAIQERYAGDQERIQLETARLYKLAGINPLAGCLPTLATIPVWIGLYRALSNVADEGLLTEGFFWIPSLAGPTTIAARQNGSGISWLFPFVDGHPPLGWSDTFAYLVLPVLLVVSQYISVKIIQSSQNNDPNMKSSQALTNFLPLMIGYFALSVPSGLSLYWFTNNLLSTAQQVWLQKFGGAKDPMKQFSDIIKDERLDINKSVPGLSSTKKEARQAEKLTTEGPRPGEKFKQIREQEARRRQQREEEKRKAAEAAAKSAFSDPTSAVDITDDIEINVKFTYSIVWSETSAQFETRMDKYSRASSLPTLHKIHWFSFINSIVFILLLMGLLILLILRRLKNDLRKCSSGDEEEDKEVGWKYIHGDVFRYPQNISLFSAVMGVGNQLLTIVCILFVLAFLGILYPYNRGLLSTSFLLLYSLTSVVAGYITSSFHNQFSDAGWERSVFLAGILYLGPLTVTVLILNTVAVSYGATAALPFGTIMVIVFIYMLFAVPLLALGGRIGYWFRSEFQAPSALNRYPREILPLPWYQKSPCQMFIVGLLSFSIIALELHHLYASLWGYKIFTLPGILFVMFIILLVLTAILSIGLTYIQLSVEDHEWWWRSVFRGGSTAIFMFAYSIYFYFRSNMSGFLQLSFFLGYNVAMCYAFFLILGSVSFRASMIFVRRIYRVVKSE